jgi:hypothetical protein
MIEAVSETRAIWRRAAFSWGAHDCIMAACDHVQRATGIDPAAPWRGTYDDEAGAQDIYNQFGGVFGLFDHGMTLAGFEKGEDKNGAVVVARVLSSEVVGVRFGAFIGFIHPTRGVTEMRLPVMAAWPL